MSVEEIISSVIAVEGRDFTNNPADRGGPTKFGITLATLTRWRAPRPVSANDVKALEEPEARAIYRQRFVTDPRFDAVMAIDEAIGTELVDCGVSMGTERAALFLIRALNVFSQHGKLYADLPTVKPRVTETALVDLQIFLTARANEDGAGVLLKTLECLRGEGYVHLAEINNEDEDFIFGWMRKRVHLAAL